MSKHAHTNSCFCPFEVMRKLACDVAVLVKIIINEISHCTVHGPFSQICISGHFSVLIRDKQ